MKNNNNNTIFERALETFPMKRMKRERKSERERARMKINDVVEAPFRNNKGFIRITLYFVLVFRFGVFNRCRLKKLLWVANKRWIFCSRIKLGEKKMKQKHLICLWKLYFVFLILFFLSLHLLCLCVFVYLIFLWSTQSV